MAHGAWPTDTFVGAKMKMFFNHEPIEVLRVRAYGWRRDRLVSALGCHRGRRRLQPTSYPRFDPRRRLAAGTLDVLNHIIDISVAEFNQQGGTRIVRPRRISNQSDVVETATWRRSSATACATP